MLGSRLAALTGDVHLEQHGFVIDLFADEFTRMRDREQLHVSTNPSAGPEYLRRSDPSQQTLLLSNLISRLLPCLDATAKRFDIQISHPQVFDCLTGRRMLIGSGAIEDDRLVLLEIRQSRLEFLQGYRPLEHHRVAFRLVLIGTDQDGLT